MLFTDFTLDERLQRALVTSGFVTPTPIQVAAMPVVFEGRDLVGTAQTGTGKTAAFLLPILHRLIETPLDMRRTRALILAPTRELVEQIIEVARELGVHTNIRGIAVYGGVPMFKQTRALRGGFELIVACPGRLLDHINRRNTDFRHLDYLVLDEADRMLDMGFLPSIEEIISNLPGKRQTLLFSATFPTRLNAFVRKMLLDPVRVEVDTAVPAQTVHHTLYHVKQNMKTALLTTLLREIAPESDSVLIFTRTRLGASQLAEHLTAEGMQADVLHAEKTQRARQDTLEQFRAGHFPYLVATDIAARGIDVTSISHVINFDLPTKADDYLHRIGRTGRMERRGYAISLVTRGDGRAVHEIERMLGKKIEIAEIGGSGPHQFRDDPAMQPHTKAARQSFQYAVPRPAHRPLKSSEQREETRPGRAPRQGARPEYIPRNERSPRARHDERPSRNIHPRSVFSAEGAAEAPGRAARPAPRHSDSAPFRTGRPQRKSYGEAPPVRQEQTRKPFPGNSLGARPPRPERPERAPRHQDETSRPQPRKYSDDSRAAESRTSRPPRPERPGRIPFTGMASTAKKHRKNPGNKRKSGEVPFTPRPQGPTADAPFIPRNGRSSGRER